jgi:hypothetical protein
MASPFVTTLFPAGPWDISLKDDVTVQFLPLDVSFMEGPHRSPSHQNLGAIHALHTAHYAQYRFWIFIFNNNHIDS